MVIDQLITERTDAFSTHASRRSLAGKKGAKLKEDQERKRKLDQAEQRVHRKKCRPASGATLEIELVWRMSLVLRLV